MACDVALQEFVQLLLANGCQAGAAAGDDMNALHFAAQRGHEAIVQLLLNEGKMSVNSRTRKGVSALAMAAQHGALHVHVAGHHRQCAQRMWQQM